MKALLTQAKLNFVQYWIAGVWFVLFSLNALATSIIAALTGAKWDQISGQEKFLICVAIFANWSGVIMAFMSKAAKATRVPIIGEDADGGVPQ